ncbi:iron complex outermembrane recepter protein [Mariniphaga anaerophila]|uniref:Iron complex outermembrane recepter protein n=1 Tax=Mariniphaga anaerophila TaxID=1484053 RepID=A0A1M5EUJ6_9BACT|nr:TonB-dependent receptor [Mariniphaga anaerophila]SHF82692.1 iron complex outermembrane recepter protein [Mariniphaga anaerophila]
MKRKFRESKQRSFLSFRKWGRKNFSLFSTLHRVVKVSVLSVAYFGSTPVLSVAMSQDTSSVKMEYDLEEIEVSASRAPSVYSEIARVLTVIDTKSIEQGPATSVQELLEQVAAIDVRQRGAEGVQADISIRGGTFDQTLILLNGINITDPQTGHHNLNLPVSLSQIERIEVLKGPAARVYGPNAFSGAINIVTKQNAGKMLEAQVNAGSYKYFDSNLSAGFATGQMNHLLAGNYKSSDGYIDNTDFNSTNVFYSGNLSSAIGKLSAQAGYTDKGFGANSFYTPVYPDQYESTQTTFSSVRLESLTKFNLTPALYFRRHSDKFMLFRNESPDWYENHNFHRTDVKGASLNSWYLWKAGKTSVGAEFRSEKILSNVLGEEMPSFVKVPGEDAFYTKSKNRQIMSLFAEHIFYLNNFTLSTGIMGNHISDEKSEWNFFPGIDISYRLSSSLKAVASWNTSLRMPTFTDLYYSGRTNIGNPLLKPEKSKMLEGGIKMNSKFVNGHLVVFHSRGTNIIDWVKTESDDLWKSMNHTSIVNTGFELDMEFSHWKLLGVNRQGSIRLGYVYNNQDKMSGELISYYVLDNLKHKLVASLNQPVSGNLSFNINFTYQNREGTYTSYNNGSSGSETSYNPFWLVDTKLLYQRNNFKFYVTANNLFNKRYFDLGNIAQPGRWLKTGISYNLNFN